MRRALPLLGPLLLLAACGGPEHDWTAEQIGNADYIFAALQSDKRAAEIENLGEPGFDDRAEEKAALEHRDAALVAARSVRDEILDKAHPRLRPHWRDEFQRSQALFLEARRAGRGRSDLETRAIELRNAFGDWWVRHRHELSVPRRP